MLVIKGPVVTEKSLDKAQAGVYAFAVHRDATKPMIAQAITRLYGVAVAAVRVQSVRGQSVRRKTGLEFKNNWKKALVTVKKGQKIKEFEIPKQEAAKNADKPADKSAKEQKAKE